MLSPRHSNWSTLLRRLVAVVAVVCLGGSWMEAVVPDIHDGNAGSMSHAGVPSVVAAVGAADLHPGGQHTEPPRARAHGDAPGEIPHPIQVEHCGHSHTLVDPATAPAADVRIPCSAATWPRGDDLASIVRQPQFRPPIA